MLGYWQTSDHSLVAAAVADEIFQQYQNAGPILYIQRLKSFTNKMYSVSLDHAEKQMDNITPLKAVKLVYLT